MQWYRKENARLKTYRKKNIIWSKFDRKQIRTQPWQIVIDRKCASTTTKPSYAIHMHDCFDDLETNFLSILSMSMRARVLGVLSEWANIKSLIHSSFHTLLDLMTAQKNFSSISARLVIWKSNALASVCNYSNLYTAQLWRNTYKINEYIFHSVCAQSSIQSMGILRKPQIHSSMPSEESITIYSMYKWDGEKYTFQRNTPTTHTHFST